MSLGLAAGLDLSQFKNYTQIIKPGSGLSAVITTTALSRSSRIKNYALLAILTSYTTVLSLAYTNPSQPVVVVWSNRLRGQYSNDPLVPMLLETYLSQLANDVEVPGTAFVIHSGSYRWDLLSSPHSVMRHLLAFI